MKPLRYVMCAVLALGIVGMIASAWAGDVVIKRRFVRVERVFKVDCEWAGEELICDQVYLLDENGDGYLECYSVANDMYLGILHEFPVGKDEMGYECIDGVDFGTGPPDFPDSPIHRMPRQPIKKMPAK